ncbi:MAG: fatty acid cis/trans isomerase [Bacteriovoracaceae bacterium]|nr:fatty acid cis/trans isomerase [Bacteriovoracaceae bacterium]
MSMNSTLGTFMTSFLKILFIVIQVGIASDAMGFESYYRNQDFKMTSESKDVFYGQVKPILDKRCVACHSCRESECRLKLTSLEGLIRGAHTKKNTGGVLTDVTRNKLFHDAAGEAEWRKRGFYSVLKSPLGIQRRMRRSGSRDRLGRNSILTAALANKYENQEVLDRLDLMGPDNNSCGEGRKSYDNVPGMPYKMHPLRPVEFATLFNWSNSRGNADLPSAETLLMLTTPKNPEIVRKWENFFNHSSAKAKWTSRFLYEHLFLARLYFEESPGEFYELVRSKTAYPKPIVVSPTIHAFDKPKVEGFYYRLRKIHSTIVDKNHFVYEVNDNILKELKEMFWNIDWGHGNNHVKFSFKNTNPLVAFKHIPAKSRYTWMLKNAHLLLDISARSQNCRTEGASAPYWDNMLHVFIKPDSDPTVAYGKKFYDEAGKYLPIPNVTGGRISPFRDFNKEQRKYAKIKSKYSKKLHPEGLTVDDIWLGDNEEDKNAIVTVLRHQWTASTVKGQPGKMPRSALLMDFAIFERYFYLCNVATEISEALLGQSRVVTYLFDVKKEAENHLLSLIPPKHRDGIRQSLVEGLDANYQFINGFTYPYNEENGFTFEKVSSYSGFLWEILEKTFKPEVVGERSFVIKSGFMSENNTKTKLENLSDIKGTMGTHMPNVSYLRVANEDGSIEYFTITANRYYKTRNKLSFTDTNFEKTQRRPELDYLEIFEGIFINFPEKIYMINSNEVDDFIKDLKVLTSRGRFMAFNKVYGLDQNSEDFWTIIDEVNSTYIRKNPIHGGIIDLHRYGSLDDKEPL